MGYVVDGRGHCVFSACRLGLSPDQHKAKISPAYIAAIVYVGTLPSLSSALGIFRLLPVYDVSLYTASMFLREGREAGHLMNLPIQGEISGFTDIP
jgi:hypothetical protein